MMDEEDEVVYYMDREDDGRTWSQSSLWFGMMTPVTMTWSHVTSPCHVMWFARVTCQLGLQR